MRNAELKEWSRSYKCYPRASSALHQTPCGERNTERLAIKKSGVRRLSNAGEGVRVSVCRDAHLYCFLSESCPEERGRRRSSDFRRRQRLGRCFKYKITRKERKVQTAIMTQNQKRTAGGILKDSPGIRTLAALEDTHRRKWRLDRNTLRDDTRAFLLFIYFLCIRKQLMKYWKKEKKQRERMKERKTTMTPLTHPGKDGGQQTLFSY